MEVKFHLKNIIQHGDDDKQREEQNIGSPQTDPSSIPVGIYGGDLLICNLLNWSSSRKCREQTKNVSGCSIKLTHDGLNKSY